MSAQFILIPFVLLTLSFALAFAAAAVLVEILARPYRKAAGVHWTERARLAFAPGSAVLWLAVALPPLAAVLGDVGLQTFDERWQGTRLGWALIWVAAVAGVMTVRYRWLREVWGPRVTLRSWLSGCFFLATSIIPHYAILVLLVFSLPQTFGGRSVAVFGVGVLATAFFACGGELLLLRWIGIARPASLSVPNMVERLAQEMKVEGRIKVFELEWAQVNAAAWSARRAVGFSRPLLAVMNEDEVRAVAAHELAHLTEPWWVRAVRVGQMFIYLPAAPLIKYGGMPGIAAGFLLFAGIAISYRRFTRALEQRADRLEHQAIADGNAYLRSMIRLHQANLAPAVMPGAQTHPHLYDRLLAAGIQPEFARPNPPRQLGVMVAVFGFTILTLVLMGIVVIAAGVALHFTTGWEPPLAQDPLAAAATDPSSSHLRE